MSGNIIKIVLLPPLCAEALFAKKRVIIRLKGSKGGKVPDGVEVRS